MLVALAAVVIAWGAFGGRILVASDRPGPADAVVVPSGDADGSRLRRAVRVFRASAAGRLVVFVPSSDVFDHRDDVAEYATRRGVARERLLLVTAGASTAEEAAAAAALARRCGWGRMTAVTSPYHTRRAGWLFGRAAGERVQVHTVAAGESYDAWRWWARSEDAEKTVIEWVKSVNSLRYLLHAPAGVEPEVPC